MKKKGKKGRPVRPDDYFAAGPIEFARFGNLTIGRSRATPQQWKAAQAEMAKRYPRVVAEIDALVETIATKVIVLSPSELLSHAHMEFIAFRLEIGDRKADGFDELAAARMVDYVQSVIAARAPQAPVSDLTEQAWDSLKEDIRTLFTRLALDYQHCLTAHRRAIDPHLDLDVEQFRFQLETLWMNVRGKRYHVHERQAILDLLVPHSDVLIRVFGIDAEALVTGLDKMLSKFTHGFADAVQAFDLLRDATLDQFEALVAQEGQGADLMALRERVFDEALKGRGSEVMGELFGLDRFDVAAVTGLPPKLLHELSYPPGGETDFFAPGEFCGWPQRIWPTMKRPFILLDGRVLCFDVFSLFDNFYRVIQRAIFRLEPDYRATWNSRQQAISEQLPFTYLERILPGSKIIRPVYYRWKVGTKPADWFETDGLLIFDDHLLVIEVKAGAFTYTSPATDLPAHFSSLRNLVTSPASQGNRFVDYLESAVEVPVFNAAHTEVGRLRRNAFRSVTVCAITLDDFTHLAARADHLRKVGIDIGQRSVWVLSIDDLRAYADLINNPLVFLHFVEQRMLAAASLKVELHDEMDHYGLYLAQNNYSQFAADLMGEDIGMMNFEGYRDPIDNYFRSVLEGNPQGPPSQSMPERLREIIAFLVQTGKSKRAELSSFLLDFSSETRASIAQAIDDRLCDNERLKRPLPGSINGPRPLTFYVWSPTAPRTDGVAERHVQSIMLASGEHTRFLLELEYDNAGRLRDLSWKRVSVAALAQAEIERLRAIGVQVRDRRVTRAAQDRKIGVNEQCPCGSGLKFKRCHGRRR